MHGIIYLYLYNIWHTWSTESESSHIVHNTDNIVTFVLYNAYRLIIWILWANMWRLNSEFRWVYSILTVSRIRRHRRKWSHVEQGKQVSSFIVLEEQNNIDNCVWLANSLYKQYFIRNPYYCRHVCHRLTTNSNRYI